MITIKSPLGTDLLAVNINDGCRRSFMLMQEDYVTLKFSVATPISFPIGSYIELPPYVGEDSASRYELTELYMPTRSTKHRGWDYEVTFEADYRKWRNKIFRYMPESASSEASWSLTDTLTNHMGVFLRNLESLGYRFNGHPYVCSIDDTVENKSVCLAYENVSLLDALQMMAEEYDCEYWVTENVIHFGRCEAAGDTYTEFEEGVNVETMNAEGNRDTYATRIYAFGAERNLPKNYRPTAADVTVNGVVQKRLMLPEGTPYIDARSGMATEEAVEAVVIFDDVYPRTQSEISGITTVQYDEQDENGDPTGEKWNAYRFRIAGFEFNESYILDDTDLTVIFQTGSLAGMEFNVKFNPGGWSEGNPDYQLWEIIRNEDYGRPLPDDTLRPQNGDKVVLAGWDSTKIASLGLVTAAEQELLAKATAKMDEMKIDPNNYRCKMISKRMVDSDGNFLEYTLGTKVKLVNAGCFDTGYRLSRIIGFEYDLARPYNSPVYVVGEKASSSRLGSLEEKLDAVALAGQTYTSAGGGLGVYIIRTNDMTTPSDTNIYSALRSRREFLSRQRDDTALGRLTLKQGATSEGDVQFGANFASGMAGIGGKIGADGHGELESLMLRSWLEVPELRYNRAEVILGDQWNAPGGGIIESVNPDIVNGEVQRTGTIMLKLEDGEIGAVAVDDICKGYFHDFTNASNNATADRDDSLGNTEFSGFCTVYFRVTSVSSDNGGVNNKVGYELRPESDNWQHSFHPYEGMHFVAYGNFNDTGRQKSAYATRTYTRYLASVNTWEFSVANIAMQFGDLSNLSVFGLQMAGYSAYLQNVYYSGYIDKVDVNAPEEVQVTTDTGDFFIPTGGTLTLQSTVKKAWNDLTASVQSWEITRDSGDAAADAAWNAAHASTFHGSITLGQSDVGATILNANSLFTVTASGTDDKGIAWSASRTVAVRVEQVYPYELAIDTGGFSDIAWGETITATCFVTRGGTDCTSAVTGWSVNRNSGNAAADAIWNAAHASFAGILQIAYTSVQDDIVRTDGLSTVFTFTAVLPDGSSHTGTLSI